MATVAGLLALARASSELRREAEILLCHCLRQPRSYLYAWPESEVDNASAQRFVELLRARERGQPIAYLTGEREFWSLPLLVNRHTLIPRADTETLVSWALELPLPEVAQVADLGTGSGAIALALASERPAWTVLGVDCSEQALAVASANGRVLQIANARFARSDWFSGLGGDRFDLLVANPPYVDPADPHLGQGDLRFEPRSALVASHAGLAAIRHIVGAAPAHLLNGGWLLLEHGSEQAGAVTQLLQQAGFGALQTRQDYNGLDRITGGSLNAG
jgi:release factor glutamine methyltransferase